MINDDKLFSTDNIMLMPVGSKANISVAIFPAFGTTSKKWKCKGRAAMQCAAVWCEPR